MFRKPQELCRTWGESTCEEVAEEEREVVKGHVSKGLLFWARVLSVLFFVCFVLSRIWSGESLHLS